MTASRASYAPDGRGWLFVADALALLGATLFAVALHRPLGVAPNLTDTAAAAHVALFATFDLLVILHLGMARQYQEGRRFSRVDDLTAVLRAVFLAAAVAVFTAVITKGFLLDFEQYSRAYVAFAFLSPAAILGLSRLVSHHRQLAAFREGRYLARSLVVGGGERAGRFVDRMSGTVHLGYHGRRSEVDPEVPLDAFMAAFVREIEEFAPDEIVLALDQPRPELRAAIVREAAYRNVAVKVLPEVFESYYDMPLSQYDGVPVTTLYETSSDRFAQGIKRLIDRFASAFGLVALSPMFALIALAIWLEDRGPVFFSQERVGERGKRFYVQKFRTMHMDAEARMSEIRHLNEVDGPIFKLRDDPRVTRVGRVLRKFSLDEFPQLWNVVCGEMSLVGPRPPLPAEVDEYRPTHRRRLMVAPGMTGLWQVSGRSDTTFDEMVELDLMYIERWTFWADLRILVRTIRVVLARSGAY